MKDVRAFVACLASCLGLWGLAGCEPKPRDFADADAAAGDTGLQQEEPNAGPGGRTPVGQSSGAVVAGAATQAGANASPPSLVGTPAGGAVSTNAGASGTSSVRVCETGALDCDGLSPLKCSQEGQWQVARANCAIACSAGACAECAEAERQCKDGAALVCADGTWVLDEVCGATCEGGQCVDACTPDRLQCSGTTRLQRCNGVEYVDEQQCEFLCQEDACVGECVPDARRCDPDAENEAQSCTATGQWGENLACPSGSFCVSGACKPCDPGSRRCTETGPELCSDDGEWAPQGSCADPTPACLLGVCVECSPGEKRCHDNQLQQCNDDGWGWALLETCSGETPACIQSTAACGRCQQGDVQCGGSVVQTCNAEGGWEDSETCSGSTPRCVSGACTACDPALAERRCQDSDTTEQCGTDGNWGESHDCGGETPLCREDRNYTCGCKEGERRCSGNTPEACRGGAWVAEAQCSGQLDYCLPKSGRCVACEPGDEICQNGVAHRCSDDGGWLSLNSCAGSRVNCGGCDLGEDCTEHADCNSEACVDGACAECSPGERRCRNGNSTEVCGNDGRWGGATNCSGDLPVCRADLGAVCGCDEGEARCRNNAREVCIGGVFKTETSCSGAQPYCLAEKGQCVTCEPGTESCQSGGARFCNSQGSWTSFQSCAGNQINCGGCDLGEKCGSDADCDSGICGGGSCRACSPGQTRACGSCSGYVETCSSQWAWPGTCTATAASCANTPACNGESCCTSLLVSGGSFYRGETTSAPASVSNFCLDKYEVTVGRFREFLDAYDNWTPAADAGEHQPGAASGWQNGWGKGDELPANATAFETTLAKGTWGANDENLPLNRVTWYQAFAFCIWDGGRLPTEAEWEYAAAGGSQERTYPWGSTAPNSTLAVFSPASVQKVGSKQPGGNGRFGQSDLAGNLNEWVFDWYDAYSSPCNDCAKISETSGRVIRGGSWGSTASSLAAASRSLIAPTDPGSTDIGVRCARPAR